MRSPLTLVSEQPFVRYLRNQPVDGAPAPAPVAQPDAIEKSWLADKARTTAKIGAWMSAIRLTSDNTPLLAIPDGLAAQAMDVLAGLRNPAGLTAFAFKDVICRQLEALSKDTTYITRLARWTARGAASVYYTSIVGLSRADVRAWLGRPDYEYPADCDPYDLTPKPGGHCPAIVVGQTSARIEPPIAALIIGTTALALSWSLYRLDRYMHRNGAAAAAPPAAAPPADAAADAIAAAVEGDAAPAAAAPPQSVTEPDSDVETGLHQPLLARSSTQPHSARSEGAASRRFLSDDDEDHTRSRFEPDSLIFEMDPDLSMRQWM